MTNRLALETILFFLPIIGSVVVYRVPKHRPLLLAASLLILPPLVGEVTFASVSPGATINLASWSSWRAVLALFPFALIPYGFWSPFAGLTAWILLERTALGRRFGVGALLSGGALLGAVAGGSIFWTYLELFNIMSTEPVENPGAWVTGAAAGAVGGILVALAAIHEKKGTPSGNGARRSPASYSGSTVATQQNQ